MLHIVQIVFAGAAERPQVFLDQGEAEAAFVEHIQKTWKQSYPAYCERSGVDPDAFATARAFLDTLDLSEIGRVNYWIVDPPDSGLDTVQDLEALKQQQEKIGRLVKQVEQRAARVGDELNGLLDDIAQLSRSHEEVEPAPAEAQPVATEVAVAEPSPEPVKTVEREEDAEKYASKEWQSFVSIIMNLCGGSRSDFPLLPRNDWRQDVYNDATHLEYWEWLAVKIDRYREEAQKAGYVVVADPDTAGHFKFRTPAGDLDETSFSVELEAWCDAGMHLAQQVAAGQG